MNQVSHAAADVTKLVSKLKFDLTKRRRLRNVEGPSGRHDKIRKTITALFKHERIELNSNRADESRGYAERVCCFLIKLLFILKSVNFGRDSLWGLSQGDDGNGGLLAA